MTSPTTFVQIVFKQKILSVLLHLWQGETETASSLSLEASKKMLALNYRADAIYVLSLGVVAETMAKNYGAARTILAKLVALREDVDDIQSLGMYSYAACRLEIECGEVRFENYVDADFRKNFARFPQYIRQGFLHLLETLAPQSKLAQELSGGRYVPSETLVPLFRLG